MKYLLAILSAGAILSGAQAQTTYTWTPINASGASTFEAAANWTPAGGPPTSSTSATLVGSSTGGTMTIGTSINGSVTSDAVDNLTLDPSTTWLIETITPDENASTTNTLTVYGTLTKLGSTTTIRGNNGLSNNYGSLSLVVMGAFNLTGGGILFGTPTVPLNNVTVMGEFSSSVASAVDFNVVSGSLNGGLSITGASGSVNVNDSTSPGGISAAFITGRGTIEASPAIGSVGTLTINGASGSPGTPATYTGVLADAPSTITGSMLNLVMAGTATQILTGINTFSGGTTITSGTLAVDNTSGSGLGVGAVAVNAGGTLSGTGIIAPTAGNNITIGGTLSPGTSGAGALTFNLGSGSQLIFSSGSALNLTLGTASTSVNFTTAGNWLSGTGTWTLNLTGGTGFQFNTPYPVFTNVNTTGFAPATVTLNGTTLAPSAYAFALSGTNYVVTVVGPGDEVITSAPTAVNVATGQTATFAVTATGSGTLTYQWYFNGTALANGANIAGATTSTLTLTDVQPSQVGSYTVVISDPTGNVTSTAVGLNGAGSATFSVQPVSATLAAGQTASFYAPATGTGTVSYQWYLNGTAVASSTDAYLLVTPVSSTNAGSYTCIATDSTGSTLSEAAVLTLSASTDLGRLTNVSVRTNCGTGSANIITGFVIGGSGTDGSSKELLIRADGPELANFGVPGFLPDPSLDVFNTAGSSPVSVGQNTGWCVTQTNENQVIAAGSAVYAFPLTTNSASSAIVLTLPSDEYTENVTGASNDTGIALAEVYDVSNATETYSPTIPRLVNVSARANVAPGAGNLIAGFTIGGSTDKTVLVRGTGPGLSEFGLTGLLDQPTLAVYSTSSGDTLVGTNTGWDEDPVLATAAASVYAFGQTSSADCSLLVTLPPGTYTANLNSNDGTSGLALVEVYEVP